jgi:DNA invertase Pin-like site-specific DNA recombinase
MTTDDTHQKRFAVGYFRSRRSNDPATENLDRQIRAYAVAHGYAIITIYRDEGELARIGAQPSLTKAISQIEQRKSAYIIIPTWHHLARRLDSAEQIINRIRSYDGYVISIG